MVTLIGDIRASDATSGTFVEHRKIWPIYLPKEMQLPENKRVSIAIFAGSGDEGEIQSGYSLFEDEIWKFHSISSLPGLSNASPRIPNIFTNREVRDLVRNIESRLINENRRKTDSTCDLFESGRASFLFATVTEEGDPHLWVFNSSGKRYDARNQLGYAFIGSGEQYAILLAKLLGVNELNIEKWNHDVLAAFLIDEVSKLHSGVSEFQDYKSSYLMQLRNRQILSGPLKKTSFTNVKRSVSLRVAMFRKVWDISERYGTEKLAKYLADFNRNVNHRRK